MARCKGNVPVHDDLDVLVPGSGQVRGFLELRQALHDDVAEAVLAQHARGLRFLRLEAEEARGADQGQETLDVARLQRGQLLVHDVLDRVRLAGVNQNGRFGGQQPVFVAEAEFAGRSGWDLATTLVAGAANDEHELVVRRVARVGLGQLLQPFREGDFLPVARDHDVPGLHPRTLGRRVRPHLGHQHDRPN